MAAHHFWDVSEQLADAVNFEHGERAREQGLLPTTEPIDFDRRPPRSELVVDRPERYR